MNREHVKGAYAKAKGAVKDAFGKMTGKKKMQAEGKMDKAKGQMHEKAGNVKDTVEHASR
jgi:uncharacterized protein YjbJ (UPF0337 family)